MSTPAIAPNRWLSQLTLACSGRTPQTMLPYRKTTISETAINATRLRNRPLKNRKAAKP